jgi:hypothetical protein
MKVLGGETRASFDCRYADRKCLMSREFFLK